MAFLELLWTVRTLFGILRIMGALLKPRCTLCGDKIGKKEIIKWYKSAGGDWKKTCVSCFKNVPTRTEKPGEQYHIKKDNQWRLW